MNYDEKTDYQALINAEKAKGSNANASTLAELETARNAKIANGNGNGYTQTYNYSTPSGTAKLTSATTQSDYLNGLYAAQKAQAVSGLQAAYDANVIDLNATKAKIPETYNTARNATAATSAQNKASFNEAAAANGLNSGTGGQASLSMANTLAGNLSSLDKAQASSIADIETQRSKLTAQYNNAIQTAIAESDYVKAQALYNEAIRLDNSLVSTAQSQASIDISQQQYNEQYQTSQNQYSDEMAITKAQALAATGNYSGFKSPPYNWTDEQVAQAEAYWKQANGMY